MMDAPEELLKDLAGLSPAELAQVREYIAFLRWRRMGAASWGTDAHLWRFNFLEHLATAEISAASGRLPGGVRSPAGMEVKAAEAVVGGERRPALWQHPPLEGEAVVEFHVPVPLDVRELRLRCAIGIRDGAQGGERLVAYRIRVAGWQIWSRAAWPRRWEPVEIPLPFQAGDVLRVAFATDALGDHQWAWAVWGEPELVGRLAAPPG